MIFLDTCVWIELLGVRTPVEPHEVRQARAGSLKEFRMFQEFQAAKELCAVVTADMARLGNSEILHILHGVTGMWN